MEEWERPVFQKEKWGEQTRSQGTTQVCVCLSLSLLMGVGVAPSINWARGG